MEIKIEKNVPLVSKRTGRKSKYPFKDMEIGDSFVVKERYPAAGAATTAAKKLKRKFVTRKQDDGTYRIWRIE